MNSGQQVETRKMHVSTQQLSAGREGVGLEIHGQDKEGGDGGKA